MNSLDLRSGDHVCALYSTRDELAEIVADYLADGLRRGQRAWFICPGDEAADVRAALLRRIDVNAETARGSLQLISGADTYVVHGSFDPERAIATFNEAIDQAYRDGFTGFRAAAEMSWAMTDTSRMQQLIVYEALLRTLFSTSRATGLCLYHRSSTPLDVVGGALATHPVVRSVDGYCVNPFYDVSTNRLIPADAKSVMARMAALETPLDSTES
jgi:chemotaxis family two-component system sensor kinase Cph1